MYEGKFWTRWLHEEGDALKLGETEEFIEGCIPISRCAVFERGNCTDTLSTRADVIGERRRL